MPDKKIAMAPTPFFRPGMWEYAANVLIVQQIGMLHESHVFAEKDAKPDPKLSDELFEQKQFWIEKFREARHLYYRIMGEAVLDVFGFEPGEPHPRCSVQVKDVGAATPTLVWVDADDTVGFEHDSEFRDESDDAPYFRRLDRFMDKDWGKEGDDEDGGD